MIYIFRINDTAHEGCLKIGETTFDSIDISLQPNCKELNDAAKKRINPYTQTAGIAYELLHTEISIYSRGGSVCAFSDHEVHHVLGRSGIEKKIFYIENEPNEWYITDLETAKKAISAVKSGRQSLGVHEVTKDNSPVIFRPEQREAIDKTKKQFKKGKEMLWNAKMRFGKTLSTLQVVKEMEIGRTLILTHRPVVDDGWFTDFSKIFYDRPDFKYGSKNTGDRYSTLEQAYTKSGQKYICFVSMQDLRGSSRVGGNHDKNDDIFDTPWDLIIIDEAHEGTQTDLGANVLVELSKSHTKVIHLSGTPFNLLENRKEEEIYTWDYVMEQRAKKEWDETHLGDPNPYISLPRMNIYTYDLGKLLPKYDDGEVAFNFREFFRVDSEGVFLHEKDILSLLDMICREDTESRYPYSTAAYRENFRHSLWMIPGVKEAKALSTLLQSHSVFGQFQIVNVAGDGDDESKNEESLKQVQSAIGKNPEDTYTITLSCGRLTTGVSVPAWTAVLMLSGSSSTSAAGYMQTIFRVQTPATIAGRIKEECYVFDFAPDRTLRVIAEAVKISTKAGKSGNDDKRIMGEFLNFCPIISIDGSRMREYNVENMLEQLKKIYVERVVNNGFEDRYLYNDNLMQLDEIELQEFDNLKAIIGSTKAIAKSGDIDVNTQGFTQEEYAELARIEKKEKEKIPLTEQEEKILKEKDTKKKNRESAISILRGISIRMPLMIYGADIADESTEMTIENFEHLVDDLSWAEFMPKGVTKTEFKKFKKYYDPDIFRAAGRRIRTLARAADSLSIEERIVHITTIFQSFKNPDKETILTPWRVVNMHIGDCLGGYVWWDESYKNPISEPRYVDQGTVTQQVYTTDTRILEINSKSGVYPLYMAYSIYRAILASTYPDTDSADIPTEVHTQIWDTVVRENIYIICKTPMAKNITKRTLVGFRDAKVNTKYFEDLILQITEKSSNFVEKVRQGKTYWKTPNSDTMKFNAIIGNPPYQIMDGGASASAKPVYHHFVDIAKQLQPDYISMIMPSRWYAGGKGLDGFREDMLGDNRIYKIVDFENSNEVFPGVDIAGGVCYLLWDSVHTGECNMTNFYAGKSVVSVRDLGEFDILIRHETALPIIRKVRDMYENSGKMLSERVSSRKPFSLPTNYVPQKSGIPCHFTQKLGRQYASEGDITDESNLLGKWKLLIPPAPIAGQTDFSKPVGFYTDTNTIIARPGECCTESYIVAYSADTEAEILSFRSYLFTKIVRFLLLQKVISQHVTRKNFCFIPDLGTYSGIYTDDMLRTRWGISQDEWEFIDSRIR